MKVGTTGHRPSKLSYPGWSGYLEDNPLRVQARAACKRELTRLEAVQGYTGMALGWDLDFACVCIDLQIPFVACVPFVGQELRWNPVQQARYREILAQASEVVVVSDGDYARYKMDLRDQYVVDHVSHMIALWDGTASGTGNTVRYARQIGRPLTIIDPNHRPKSV